MSVSIQLVQDQPNPKVMSFRIGKNLLGEKISKLVVSKDGQLVNHVPLAILFFRAAHAVEDFSRIDITSEKNGTTLVGLSRLKEWTEESKQTSGQVMRQFIDGDYVTALEGNILQTMPLQTVFQAGDNTIYKLVEGAFQQKVNPKIASHGGAMDIAKISYDQATGKVSADVFMIGSCNGCVAAEEFTIKGATKEIQNTFAALQKQYPENQKLQSLSFDKINTIQTGSKDLVLINR